MIHTTTSTVKFRRLSRALASHYGVSRAMADTLAVGHLERLWHLTISSAKRGDIGRITNIEIADEIGWEGDPDELIDLLVDLEWLDRSEEYRLVVHDWHEHRPHFLNKNIARMGGYVTGPKTTSSANKPSHTDSAEDSDASGEDGLSSGEDVSERIPPHVRTKQAVLSPEARTPNLTKPNLSAGSRYRQSKATKNIGDLDDADASVEPPDRLEAFALVRRIVSRKRMKPQPSDLRLAWGLVALKPTLGEAWLGDVVDAVTQVEEPPRNPFAYARTVAATGNRERPGPGADQLRELLARVPPPPLDWPEKELEMRQ